MEIYPRFKGICHPQRLQVTPQYLRYPDNVHASANFFFFYSLADTRNCTKEQWDVVSVRTRKKTNQVCDDLHDSAKHTSAMAA
jgi:hypothetical protein